MPTPQEIYDELNKRGAFKKDAQAAAIGHELRRRGVVHDITEGGRLSADPGDSDHDPYGDPADQMTFPKKPTPRPAPRAAGSPINRAKGFIATAPVALSHGSGRSAPAHSLPTHSALEDHAVATANFFKDLVGANGRRGEIHQGLIALIGANPKQKHGAFHEGAVAAGKLLYHAAQPLIPGNDSPLTISQGNDAMDGAAAGVVGGVANDPFVKNAARLATGRKTHLGDDVTANKLQTLADLLPGLGGASRVLRGASGVAEAAGAASLAGGLAKGADVAHAVATLGPVGKAVGGGAGKAAQAAGRLPGRGIARLSEFAGKHNPHLKPGRADVPETPAPEGHEIPGIDPAVTAKSVTRAAARSEAAPPPPMPTPPLPGRTEPPVPAAPPQSLDNQPPVPQSLAPQAAEQPAPVPNQAMPEPGPAQEPPQAAAPAPAAPAHALAALNLPALAKKASDLAPQNVNGQWQWPVSEDAYNAAKSAASAAHHQAVQIMQDAGHENADAALVNDKMFGYPRLQQTITEAGAERSTSPGVPAPQETPAGAGAGAAGAGAGAAGAGVAEVRPAARPKPVMAGSINLDNLETTPEAKAKVSETHDKAQGGIGPGLPAITHEEVKAQARALKLTPEHLKDLTPGQPPASVPAPVFDTALRELHTAKAEGAARADAAYKDGPTPDNLAAMVKANQDLKTVAAHTAARAASAGQTLGAYNIQASAFEGALAKAGETQQVLAHTPSLADVTGPAAMKVSTRSKTFGGGNKIFTAEERDAALARLKQAGQRVNSGVDPGALVDLVKVGGYYLEGGLRDFGAWSKEMLTHVPGLSPADLQQVWAHTRAEAKSQVANFQKKAASTVLADQLAPRLGRDGVAGFIDAVADAPHPDLLGRLLRGDPLSEAEKQTVSDAYFNHLPKKSKPAPSTGALKTINDIAAETRKPQMQARMAALRAARGPRAVRDALTQSLTGRLGKAGAQEFVARLQADPATRGILTRLSSGHPLTDAEARTVAGHLDDLKAGKKPAAPSDVSKLLTGIVRDAKAGRLGYDSAKAAVREEMLKAVPEEKVPALTAALAKVGDNDFHALANVYNRFKPVGMVDKIKTVQQASLLSGPKTLGAIAAAHSLGAGFEDLAVRPVAAALSGGTVQGLSPKATLAAVKAGIQALPEGARMLKEGPTAMQLRGISPGYHTEEIPGRHLHGEPIQSPVVRAPGRVHAALYHIVGEALKERGIQEFSALKARQKGGSADQYRADPDVLKAADNFRAEQLYQNKNRAASAISHAAEAGGPVGKVALNTLVPFRNVPTNLAGRGLEYSGLGVPLAAARAAGKKLTGKDLMSGKAVEPEEEDAFRRGLALQAARGIVGPAAGLAGGAGLTAAGVLNPPNEKTHENGSVNVGGNKFDVSRLQPVSTPLLEGGEAYNALHGRTADPLAPFEDNPYLSLGQQVQDARDGFSGKSDGLKKVVGALVGELSPTLLAQIAAATDPSGEVRKKNTAWDYLENRVPGLRERLETMPFPQSSNYKSTGPASLLSPVSVTPRSGQDTPAGVMLRELTAAKAPARSGPMTPAQEAAHALLTQARQGRDVRPQVVQDIRDGKMTQAAGETLLRSAQVSGNEAAIRSLPLADAFRVWGAASAEEKRKWRPAYLLKLQGAADRGTLTRAQVDRARSLGILPPLPQIPAPAPPGVKSLSEYAK